jgi:hypothetical protein
MLFGIIAASAILGGSVLVVGALARRYERRRLEDGSWNSEGPQQPTPAPEDYSQSRGRQALDVFQPQLREERELDTKPDSGEAD